MVGADKTPCRIVATPTQSSRDAFIADEFEGQSQMYILKAIESVLETFKSDD